MRVSGLLSSAAALAASALAAPATFQPNTGITLSVSVPASTSSSGSGNMYMQFSAPTSYQWAAFGIGQGMAGSTIFVIYTDGAGNVTLSPRNGVGEFMPQFSTSISSQATLLAGSGVANGMMVANIRFTTTSSTINAAGTSTNWISAWYQGSALATTSTSARIPMHDAHAQFSLDLSQATQSTDVNPFVQAAAAGGATTTASSGSTSPTGVSAPITSGNGGVATGPDLSSMNRMIRAHGVIMSVVMIAVFPVGAMFIRLFGGPWIHGAIQLLGLALLIAGFALGYHVASEQGRLYKSTALTHTVFGTVMFGLFLVQPFGGVLHHLQYKKIQKRGAFGYAHVWFGRTIIILGVVNGGLGLKLAAADTKFIIAYSVVAGVIFLAYLGVFGLTAAKKRRTGKAERAESASSSTQQATAYTTETK